MNNGSQGQPGQGQPAGAQQRPHVYKAEHMRQLPNFFTAEEKEKWENGLRNLYSQLEKNGPETPAHQDAKRKILEFSKNLSAKMQKARESQQQAAGARPGNQGQPQSQSGVANNNNNAAAAGQQRPQLSKEILDHVNSFPFILPQNLVKGTPDAGKWIQEMKSKYARALSSMETVNQRIQAFDAHKKKRVEEGKPYSAEEEKEYSEKRQSMMKLSAEAKNYVNQLRAQHQPNRGNQGEQKQNHQANTMGQGAGGDGNASANGDNQAPVRPQMNPQQQSNSNPAAQNTQTVNAAIEAARNQQMQANRGSMQQNGGIPQMPNQNVPSHMSQLAGGPVQQIKQEAGVPHINTNLQGRPMQNNSPQTSIPQSATSIGPQSATSAQIPRPLTHPQALQNAARTYSSGQTTSTPNVMGGHSHTHPTVSRDNTNAPTTKMPIPKTLPERATMPPQPVTMPQSRPTFTGGPNGSGSMLGQPVIQKPPGYNMEGDGNRVLNKKKLDELVRQVTGGGEGVGGGEGLTPEVEESILNVADTFVDQVLQAACKNAKERGSKILEIRDIQLTLERAYNIRIPGYASDEIRTVRKITPSPAWISKMSAVQASKVTGGRMDG